jgi:hypothetical protein
LYIIEINSRWSYLSVDPYNVNRKKRSGAFSFVPFREFRKHRYIFHTYVVVAYNHEETCEDIRVECNKNDDSAVALVVVVVVYE